MLRKILQPFYTTYVILLFAVSLFIFFPVYFIIGCLPAGVSGRSMWWLTHRWSNVWLFLLGMPVSVRGHYPKDGRKYVIIANHISYLDPVVVYAAIPWYFRALAKIELARVPLFGYIYKRLALVVDRQSAESRAASMRKMQQVLRKESHIFIYPEGTFNESEAPVKEFYDGAFRLAINTNTPILPLILHDTVHRWHFSGWWKVWPGKNRVTVLEPVEVTGYTLSDMKELKKRVSEIMSRELSE